MYGWIHFRAFLPFFLPPLFPLAVSLRSNRASRLSPLRLRESRYAMVVIYVMYAGGVSLLLLLCLLSLWWWW
jgi:hypothetical protein